MSPLQHGMGPGLWGRCEVQRPPLGKESSSRGQLEKPWPLVRSLAMQRLLASGARGKEPACQCRLDVRDAGLIPSREDPLEKGRAPPSSIPAWRIPWTGEPGGLQSIGLHSVGLG